jgi:(1->4)-alpha-D-glucan 1-alpha-D-glucosylmutase
MNVPTATYRLQFNAQFGFRHAAGIVSYLADMGISHIYASPIFMARKGSSHGYDGIDPGRLNPDLGSSQEFDELASVRQKHQIGWLQDIVPNHMAFDYENQILLDVLENGPSSEYYHFFDIAWDHPDPGMQGRLLAPFLGRPYSECLENGQLTLDYSAAGFAVVYYDQKLPLSMASYAKILGHEAPGIESDPGEEQVDLVLLFDRIDHLASPALPLAFADRRKQVRSIKERLWDLYGRNATVKKIIDQNLRRFNAERPGEGRFDLIDQLLSCQTFRLCHWKVACEEINYRRFFDINELIALCQQKESVFDHTHALLAELTSGGLVSGVRIDHVDGLYDPAEYLQRLRHCLGDIYVVVEKILEPAERLPDGWPVQGTTGYEFGRMVNGLFILRRNEKKITEIYSRFSRRRDAFENIVAAGKRKVLESQMAGELDNLAALIKQLAVRTRAGRDFTLKRLKEALSEILVRFPVYRTYTESQSPRQADELYTRSAVALSVLHRPDRQPELAFLQRLLLGGFGKELARNSSENKPLYRGMTARLQQLTAPLMAKGLEDTALYVYNRLVSLNEVGNDPSRFGCNTDDFHAFTQERADSWPHTMNSTATHDSKRGEDVRARINVLSEMPGQWEAHLKSWQALNRKKKIRLNAEEVPDPNEEYLLYQTLLGAYPFDAKPGTAFAERIGDYLVKAVREAKIHSSWIEVNAEYEAALVSFARKILDPNAAGRFLKSFLPFFKMVACYGIWNSLSQTLIKITAPGVPDFYQGSELFDLHLVDPDNRGAVDFQKRKRYLIQILKDFSSDPLHLIEQLLAHRRDGRIKLFLTARALHTRKAHAALFQHGGYLPLAAAGKFKGHVIAFARTYKNHCSVTVAPRLLTTLVGEDQDPLGERIWRDTAIIMPQKAVSRWHNIFTEEILSPGDKLKIGTIFQHFPCALLIGKDIE